MILLIVTRYYNLEIVTVFTSKIITNYLRLIFLSVALSKSHLDLLSKILTVADDNYCTKVLKCSISSVQVPSKIIWIFKK